MLLLIYVATSSTLHVRSLSAIRRCLFLAPFALLIFLFNSAILTSMRLGLDQGCSLSGTSLTGSLGTLIDSRQASDFSSATDTLSGSLFMVLIFFLLKPEWADLDTRDIFSFSSSICNFRALVSEFRLTNFLANLVSLAHLRLHCLLVKGIAVSVEDDDSCRVLGAGPLRGALLHAGCGGVLVGWFLSLSQRKAISSAFLNLK